MHTLTPDERRTALIVEYDNWERNFTTDLLTAHGYLVLGASNGVSALRLAERNVCDVILLDLILPELRGCHVLRELKSTRATRGVPVILIGAPSEEEGRLAAGVVSRPLEGPRVVQEVGRVLGQAEPPSVQRRACPLVVVASDDARVTDRLADGVRRRGWLACAATSLSGCLRVATTIGPDLIVLDQALPSRLDRLLRAHPVSAAAQIVRVADDGATWPTALTTHGSPSSAGYPKPVR